MNQKEKWAFEECLKNADSGSGYEMAWLDGFEFAKEKFMELVTEERIDMRSSLIDKIGEEEVESGSQPVEKKD